MADIEEAVAELRAAGVEIVLDPQGGETRAWVHFRAPDGFVYELVEDRSAWPRINGGPPDEHADDQTRAGFRPCATLTGAGTT